MKFNQILTELMEARGISAYKIWKETGISQSIIGKWKSGEKEPTSEYLQKMADYFGVTTDYLLGNKKSPADMTIDEAKKEIYEIAKRLSPENYDRLLDHARLLQAFEQKKAKE